MCGEKERVVTRMSLPALKPDTGSKQLPATLAIKWVHSCRRSTAMYGNVLQYTAMYCDVWQCTAIYCDVWQCTAIACNVRQYTAMYGNVLRCTAMYCNIWQCTANTRTKTVPPECTANVLHGGRKSDLGFPTCSRRTSRYCNCDNTEEMWLCIPYLSQTAQVVTIIMTQLTKRWACIHYLPIQITIW